MSRCHLSPAIVSLAVFASLAGCAEPPENETATPSAIPGPTATPAPTPSPSPTLPSPSFEEDLGQVEAVAALHITYNNPLYETPLAEFGSLALTNAPGMTGEDLAEVSGAYHALFVWMEMIATDPYPPETCRIALDAAETLAEGLEPMVGEGRYVVYLIPHASDSSERTLYEEGVYWETRSGGTPPAGTVGGLFGAYLPLEVNPAEIIAESFNMAACLDGAIPWDAEALALAWDEWLLGNVTLDASFTEEGALRASLSDVEVYNGKGETLESGLLQGATLSSAIYEVAVTLPEEGGPQRQQ